MSIFSALLTFLESEAKTPAIFGVYHICCLLLVVAATVFLCLKMRDADDKAVRRLLFFAWLLLVVLEVYKQFIYTVELENGVLTADYRWFAFPFQFCSMPLYTLPFAIWLKDGKARDAVIAFLCSFSLFAGLAVMIYPGDVYTPTVGINIQTMIHHGTQVILGAFLAVHERRRLSLRHFVKGCPVFAILLSVAYLLNIAVHHALVSVGNTETFNMFFISPYHPCTLPVLSSIHDKLPYLPFFLTYLIGFCLVAALVYFVALAIIRRSSYVKK